MSRSKYTALEVEQGLHAVALSSGNIPRALKLLAEQDAEIPESTLREWVGKTHAERYSRVCDEVLPRVYGAMAQQSEDAAMRLAEVETQLAERMSEESDNLKAGEVAGALRNVTVAKAVNVDKASLIRGRPTAITERRDASELLRSLASRFSGMVKVDNLAERGKDAQDAITISAPASEDVNAQD